MALLHIVDPAPAAAEGTAGVGVTVATPTRLPVS